MCNIVLSNVVVRGAMRLRHVAVFYVVVAVSSCAVCSYTATYITVADERTVFRRLNRDIDNINTLMPYIRQVLCGKTVHVHQVRQRVRAAVCYASENAFAVGCELNGKIDYIVDAVLDASDESGCA